ncbi:MAG: hypothetical protein IAC42_09425 [Spirochaetes bacterium]|uniref:Uncharacterized protein n=1 Tax=Candidatus Aphodenecus pullistercoris TaxID=2840669 RepID=A0A9D9HA49_9SPIR|nr:hypothetical protein [Candidatus Aphodenecus pullistercoris]
MVHVDINDPIWDGVRDRLIALGFKRGYANGIRKTRDRIARNMLKDDLPKDLVSQYTSLSAEEVDEIARSLNCED